jgi:hypothetical protein
MMDNLDNILEFVKYASNIASLPIILPPPPGV